MELLSPAGSMEAVTAAVQNGADAVYFGYGDFNARRGARNFSREEAAAAVSYCHLRGCRTHLTPFHFSPRQKGLQWGSQIEKMAL